MGSNICSNLLGDLVTDSFTTASIRTVRDLIRQAERLGVSAAVLTSEYESRLES